MARRSGRSARVDLAATGDLALCRRIAEFRPRLERFARSLARDDGLVDDLVQASLERALRSRGDWQPGTRLDSWLCRILQNVWIDELRRRKVRGETVSLDGLAASIDGEALAYRRLLLGEVGHAMACLPPPQRTVLRHVALDGLTYRETAHEMRTSIGTVMSRLARARQRLEGIVG